MKLRLFIFLAIVIILVAWAVMYELNRDDPWNSDVFFSELNTHSLSLETGNYSTDS